MTFPGLEDPWMVFCVDCETIQGVGFLLNPSTMAVAEHNNANTQERCPATQFQTKLAHIEAMLVTVNNVRVELQQTLREQEKEGS